MNTDLINKLIDVKKLEIRALQGLLPDDSVWDAETESFKPESNFTQFTLQSVKDVASVLGIANADAEAFFHHYNAVDWVNGTGNQITSLQSALMKWQNNPNKPKTTCNSSQCIVCMGIGYKCQPNQDGGKIWLCEQCFKAFRKKSQQAWGYMRLSVIESIVEQGKAKR